MKAKFIKLLVVFLAAGAFFGISPPSARAQSTQDYGDAPTNNYPTLLVQNGARHTVIVNPPIRLGALIDIDANGQPNSNASGDDVNPPTSDDEDGVTIPSPLMAGQVNTIQVSASINGFLNAWLDYNGDGDWADAGEQIFVNNALAAGVNSRAISVPSTATLGATFARFRFTTNAITGLSFTGAVNNGEVEDYPVQISGLDFGDAPTNNFPTTLALNGARHLIDPAFVLGVRIDGEPDGQQNATATGDDINPTLDDEDGVVFVGTLAPGQIATVQVTASIPAGQLGRLDGWMDFNADRDWNEANERIFTSVPLNNGLNTLTFTVPATAPLGTTFARFRLSRQGGLNFTGAAAEGEVEDYQVTLLTDRDFGDAPDPTYPTLLPSGASHIVVSNFYLGVRADTEGNGQPNAAATGDDFNPSAADDEDGVTFTSPLSPGQPASVQVVATFAAGQSARLDAWVDFNGNGSWLDAGDQIFTSLALAPGVNNLNFNVPASAKIGGTYARFRLSRQGGLRPEGAGQDGEVEDYTVTIQEGLDFGDAPDQPYPTLLAKNGARHVIVQGFHLGELVDPEADGQPTAAADGDDFTPSAGPDDEDGVSGAGPLIPGSSYTVQVTAVGASLSPAYLNAWVDFNGNGSWLDPGEQVFVSEVLVNGVNSLNFNVPAGAKSGETYARFRYSHERVLRPEGPAQDGEVEDYRVNIINDRDRCDLSCEGTDFWITFPGNYAPDPDNPVRPILRIAGAAGVTGNVSIPGLGFSTSFTVPASLSVSVTLPSAADLGDLNDSVTNKGVHVTASGEVAVYAISKVRYTSDSYLALSTSLLGTEYFVMTWKNVHENAPPLNGSQFAIVAAESNTWVTITPAYATEGHPANVPYAVLLQTPGDTYQLRNTTDAPADLTGTMITSDKPVAVFGSHRCANIPTTNQWFCDYVVEQLPPVNQWGMNFMTAPLATRTGGDTFRCLASEDNTTLSIDGVPFAVVNRGQDRQFTAAFGRRISADKPILVAQFANSADFDPPAGSFSQGDPFMMLVQATRHYENSYAVCSFTNGFTGLYLNVIAPNGVLGTVTLNGAAIGVGAFTAIGASGYSYARVPVTAPRNTVAGAAPIGVSAYGWAEYESYGHLGCLFVGDSRPPTITCNSSNVTVVLEQGKCDHEVPDFLQTVTTDDNCSGRQGITVTQSPPRGTPVGPGVHTITLTARDISGNKATCTSTFTVIDPSPVTIFCPTNVTAFCTSSNGARVNYTVRARSICDTNVPVVCNPPSGSLFPPGKTTVNCNATSLAGQKDSCAFSVDVQCGGGLTIHRTGNNTYTVTWTGSPGTLEQATHLNGPWSPVVSGVNAFSGTFGGEQLFFRVLY